MAWRATASASAYWCRPLSNVASTCSGFDCIRRRNTCSGNLTLLFRRVLLLQHSAKLRLFRLLHLLALSEGFFATLHIALLPQ